jgi:hypothetical protein
MFFEAAALFVGPLAARQPARHSVEERRALRCLTFPISRRNARSEVALIVVCVKFSKSEVG